MDANILSKAEQWLHGGYDAETVSTIEKLIKENPDEITDAFTVTWNSAPAVSAASWA